ncbi:MAG: GspE/PulE/PilB domain-containing protein, partial [Candidatus Deferrimicrobiaceae bacterium]
MGATILSRRRFNEALLATLPVSPSELESLNGLTAEEGSGFPRLLVSRGLLTPEGLLRAYQALCGIPAFRRDPDADTPAPADALPLSFLRARLLIPVSAADGTLTVAMADPLDANARDAVAKATGKRVEVMAGTEEAIREAIEKGYGEAGSSMESLVEQVGDEAPDVAGDERVEQLIGV